MYLVNLHRRSRAYKAHVLPAQTEQSIKLFALHVGRFLFFPSQRRAPLVTALRYKMPQSLYSPWMGTYLIFICCIKKHLPYYCFVNMSRLGRFPEVQGATCHQVRAVYVIQGHLRSYHRFYFLW